VVTFAVVLINLTGSVLSAIGPKMPNAIAHTRPKKFVVLTNPRSGSTWLTFLLRGQPGVMAYSELFHRIPDGVTRPRFDTAGPVRYHDLPRRGLRAFNVKRYIDQVESENTDCLAWGFKLMLGNIYEMPELLFILALRGYRLILLTRPNHFETAVSFLVAQQTGEFIGHTEATDVDTVTLDPVLVANRITRRQRAIAAMRTLRLLWPQPSAEIVYGDLAKQPLQTLGRVLETIGLTESPVPVQSPVHKQIRKSYQDLIVNFEEVATELRRRGLGHFVPAS